MFIILSLTPLVVEFCLNTEEVYYHQINITGAGILLFCRRGHGDGQRSAGEQCHGSAASGLPATVRCCRCHAARHEGGKQTQHFRHHHAQRQAGEKTKETPDTVWVACYKLTAGIARSLKVWGKWDKLFKTLKVCENWRNTWYNLSCLLQTSCRDCTVFESLGKMELFKTLKICENWVGSVKVCEFCGLQSAGEKLSAYLSETAFPKTEQ